MYHVAYNTITGEIIMTIRGNHLKRCVARNERWNRKHGYPHGKWVFAHGVNAKSRIFARLAA